MKCPPARFWVAVMVFWTTFTNYMTRVNMSISIVAMVAQKKGKSTVPECLLETGKNITTKTTEENYGPRYEWEQDIQGHLLGAYFYGFIVSCLPAGAMAEYFGGWKMIFYPTLLGAVFNALTPAAAYLHYGCVFAVRFAVGLLGGFVYPAIQSLIAAWAPPAEKSKFLSAMMGNSIGTVVTWPLVGMVTKYIGWDWGFYVLTIVLALYLVPFFFLVSDNPDVHKWISEEEKTFIAESKAGTVRKQKGLPPYWSMFKSVPFWALIVVQFGSLWGLYVLATGTPKYMVEVLGFKLQDSGFLAVLPNFSRFFSALGFGFVGDFARKKGVNVTLIRKIMVAMSHLVPGLALCLIWFCKCNAYGVIVLLVMSQVFNGAIVAGHLQNHQDLAPNYAATMYGIVSFIGGTTGFIVPAITGALTQTHNGIKEWAWVFVIGGSIYAACGIFFIIFGTSQIQSWNEKEETIETT